MYVLQQQRLYGAGVVDKKTTGTQMRHIYRQTKKANADRQTGTDSAVTMRQASVTVSEDKSQLIEICMHKTTST